MNEQHIEVLTKMVANVEKAEASPEAKEKAKAALRAGIQALEQQDRAEKPSDQGTEVGLSANDFLLNLAMGRNEDEERRSSMVNHLASLVNNEQQQESSGGAVGQLANLIQRNEA